MYLRAFDEKWGADFLRNVPELPGVYHFRDGNGAVLYVGKAKNLRRRLAQYRRAQPQRSHRKMRSIVRKAQGLTFEICGNENEAFLREIDLIQELRPPLNKVGAFYFLYPYLGLRRQPGLTQGLALCLSSATDGLEGFDFGFYGAFRSRPRSLEAYEALTYLLALLGHLTPSERKLYGSPRYTRIVVYRLLPEPVYAALEEFLAGRSDRLVPLLFASLLDKPQARALASEVQQHLHVLKRFYSEDILKLNQLKEASGHEDLCISQRDRDRLPYLARPS